MATMKQRHCDSSRGTTRLHHLPSLSSCPSQPPQPPSTAALYAANLKDEALYLASILRARLSDSAKGGDGRGLLSRALARGELDQFLVAFFSDPANLLFAREKVETRRAKIAKLSTRRLKLLGEDANVQVPRAMHEAAGGGAGQGSNSIHGGDVNSNSVCPSATHSGLSAGPQAHHSLERGRFGPVLADAAGKFNFLPARDAIDTHTPAFLSVQRDDVSELGSTASRAMSEHNGSESWHAYGQRDHDDGHGHRQQQRNELESTQSCGSLSMDSSGRRREKQKQRREKRDRDRKKTDGRSKPPVSAVESMHFEGHLLRRVCEVPGGLPGGGGCSSSNGDDDSDVNDERSEVSLLEDSGEHQLARLRRSPEMMGILVRLKALSTSLVDLDGRGADPGSSSPTRGAGSVVTGRKANFVRLAQQEYLRLFEEMLGELLKAQREKSKAFREEKRALQRELERAREAAAAMTDEAQVHAVQLEALLAVKKALATEVATQEVQLKGLEAEVETRVKMEMATKREHFAAEAIKASFMGELKRDEQTMRSRFKEVEVEVTRAEMAVRSMKHLTAKVHRTAAINKQIYRVDESKYKKIQETAENCCQTIANDDGLWDYQDGLTRQVSRNVFQRLRWQVLRRFASCPSCHGLGPYTTVTVKGDKDKRELVPSKDRADEDPTLTHQPPLQKQGKSKSRRRKANLSLDKNWAMPNVLVEFLCHLPKTAMALPIQPLRWLTREIWLILDERERIDTIDEHEGQKVQDMNDFMLELFLRRHSLRQDAELQLYIFIVAMKAHYKKSAAVRTFARLMDLLTDPPPPAPVDGDSSGGHDHDLHAKGKHSKDKRDKEHFRREEELLEQAVQPHNSHLGSAFIPVLLFTRRALLKRSKVDLEEQNRERIRQRFKSVVSFVSLHETVTRALRGFTTKPHGQEPLPTNNDVDDPDGKNGVHALGDIDETKAAASSAQPRSRQAQQDSTCSGTSGTGAREGGEIRAKQTGSGDEEGEAEAEGEEAQQGDTKGTGEDVQEMAAAVEINVLDRSKRHAAVIDRGHKKKAAPAVPKRSSDTAAGGHRAQGMHSTKKNAGSHNAASTGKKHVNAGTGTHAHATAEVHQHQHEKGLGGEPSEVPAEAVRAIDLPKHVLTEDNCTFWVSLEMAVRVLTVTLDWCTPMKRHGYMRSIERSAALLTSRGHITGVEASHSFIRSAMRKTIAAVEAGDSAVGGVAGITETMGGISGTFEEGCGVGGVVYGDAALHDARIIIDMYKVIELVMEVMLLKQNSIEHRLKALFVEGDDNGDGVLSFEEFNKIVGRAAPHFSERRVLRMFREALTSGSEGAYAIEKDVFCDVCRQHGLVQLIDIAHLERAAKRGPAAAPPGLRMLSNIRSSPRASRAAAATHAPTEIAPATTKIMPSMDHDVDPNASIDAESGPVGDGHDRDSDGSDNGDGDERQPVGEGEDSDGAEYVADDNDAGSAPDHLLSEE